MGETANARQSGPQDKAPASGWRRGTFAAALLAAAFLLTALLFVTRDGKHHDAEPSADAAGEHAASTGGAAKGPGGPAGRIPEVEAPEKPSVTRETTARAQLTVAVESGAGTSLEGAEVSLHDLPAGADGPWRPGEWEIDQSSHDITRSGRTARNGWVDLPLGEGPPPLVLWATLPGLRSAFRALAPDERSIRLVLDEAPATRVRVIDAEGQPVEGALVVHSGRRMAMGKGSGADHAATELLERANRVFERRLRTGPDGEALVGAHPARSAVQASRNGLLSAPVELQDQQEIVLRLADTFQVRGRVTWPAGYSPDPAAEVRVTELREGKSSALGSSPISADGGHGPYSLPATGAEELVFRLEAKGLIPLEERRPPPGPGDVLRLDFQPELGVDVDVRVLEAGHDSALIPLAGARAGVSWQNDESRWIWNFAETGEDGLATVSGCRPGLGWVRADKDGYTPGTLQSMNLPTPDGVPVEVHVRRAGIVRGRCTHLGQPVRDFDVAFWPVAPHLNRKVASFLDREDGRFEIDTAPFGGLYLVAASSSLPEGEVVHTTVEPGVPAEVELELASAVLGRGRVVDALTGKAIPGASIQPLAIYGDTSTFRRGVGHQVDTDGGFELQLFPDRDSRLSVTAPGYATQTATGFRVAPGQVEFGTIALGRPGRLEVVLDSGGSVDPTSIEFQADGPLDLPFTPFRPDGTVAFDHVPPGSYTFWLFPPVRPIVSFQADLLPDRDWRVRIPFHDAEPIEVRLTPFEEMRSPTDPWIYLTWWDECGNRQIHAALPSETGSAIFARIASDSFTVEVKHSEDGLLAARGFRLTPGEPRKVVLEMRSETFQVRVLDVDRRPLAGAIVMALPHEDESAAWQFSDNTDHRGKVVFRGLALQRLDVLAYHPGHGLRAVSGVQVGLDGSGDLELTLDAHHALRARVVDGDEPLAGARVYLGPSTQLFRVLYAQSDDDGLVEFPRVAPGEFLLSVHRAGTWLTSRRVRFTGSSQPFELRARRRADLLLDFVSAEGTALPHLSLELRPLDEPGSVEQWIRQGSVNGPPGALATNATGKLELRGLPHGRYECRLVDSEGEPLVVPLRLLPSQRLARTIQVP